GEQVQTQPGVLGGGRGGREVGDLHELDGGRDRAQVVGAGHLLQLRRSGGAVRSAQRGSREPGVEHGVVGITGHEGVAPSSLTHAAHSTGGADILFDVYPPLTYAVAAYLGLVAVIALVGLKKPALDPVARMAMKVGHGA